MLRQSYTKVDSIGNKPFVINLLNSNSQSQVVQIVPTKFTCVHDWGNVSAGFSDTLIINIDGTPTTFTVTEADYDSDELVTHLNTLLSASNLELSKSNHFMTLSATGGSSTFYVEDSVLARMLGFTGPDQSTSSSATQPGGSISATYTYNLHLHNWRPFIICVLDQLKAESDAQYELDPSIRRPVFFTVPLCDSYFGDTLVFEKTSDELGAFTLDPNTNSLKFSFYWITGEEVNFKNKPISFQMETVVVNT